MSENAYELVVPFVNCASNGGIFDDGAFTAGWEMGQLYQKCMTMAMIGRPSMRLVIRRDNLTQADLIAMHFDMECLEEPAPEALGDDIASQWAYVIFGYDIINDTVGYDDTGEVTP